MYINYDVFVPQDWDFPHFVGAIDVKLPGVNTAHVYFQIPKLLKSLEYWHVHISGCPFFCSYCPLIYLALARTHLRMPTLCSYCPLIYLARTHLRFSTFLFTLSPHIFIMYMSQVVPSSVHTVPLYIYHVHISGCPLFCSYCFLIYLAFKHLRLSPLLSILSPHISSSVMYTSQVVHSSVHTVPTYPSYCPLIYLA